jgi:DNA-binding LacI/PurR family transcriptional regulator
MKRQPTVAMKSGLLGRKPLRREQVINHLRSLIVSGKFLPGARLPTYEELGRRLRAESPTIRAAMGILLDEGFIETRPRHGSFVAARPPHLHQLALVFNNDPKSPLDESYTWSRYYQSLTQAATDFERTSGRRVLQFFGVNWHTDAPDRARLIEHLQSQRLAGVVFANIPLYMDDSPILRLPGIPRVAFETESLHANVRAVNFDVRQWLDKALDWLVSQGCRRVAMIRHGAPDAALFDNPEHRRFCEALDRRGLTTKSRWLQLATMNQRLAARQVAELLMADRERPDALLVTDDNYVEPALEGLLAAGVRVPDDVAVVGHANWPLPPAKTLPVRLLGYDQRTMLRTAVEVIDRWRAGEKPAEAVILPALWEEEAVDAAPPPRGCRPSRGHEVMTSQLKPKGPMR